MAITTVHHLNARSNLKHQILEKLRAVSGSRRLHVQSLLEIIKVRTVGFGTDGFIRNSFRRLVGRGSPKRDASTRLNKYRFKNKVSRTWGMKQKHYFHTPTLLCIGQKRTDVTVSVFFSPDHKIQIESRLGWERRIRDAPKNDQFS